MTRKKTERTGEFVAADEHGKEYRIIEFTEYHDASTFATPNVWAEGLREFRLGDGSHVNQISDSEYEIVASGVRLRVEN